MVIFSFYQTEYLQRDERKNAFINERENNVPGLKDFRCKIQTYRSCAAAESRSFISYNIITSVTD